VAELKGAEVIVEHLVQERVPYVFGVCGHGILGFLDAVYDRRDELKAISVHHESVAALMADAWYRVRQEPVATFTSCGPGSANLPVGIASACMDSSAFLAITGDVPTQQWGRGPFQETGKQFQGDFVNVLRPYVKRSFQPTRVDMIPLAMRQAFALMRTGRPGPVHVDVPLNVFVEKADVEVLAGGYESAPPAADPTAVRRAAELLAAAERPVIVAGHGVELSGAEEALLAFARRASIPVATTPLGKGVIDDRDPLSLGPTGRNGTYAANAACRNADVVLALGTRFDDRATSAWLPGFTYRIPPSRLIHVDLDASEIGRNFPVELGIVGDARLVLEQLGAVYDGVGADREDWARRVALWKDRWAEEVAGARGSDATPIHPARLVAEVRRAVPEDGILLADVGVHHNWLVCEYPAYRSHSLLQSWGFASMGFGVAGSLGAKLAAPERAVVTVCGDGGFLMFPSAVATAVEYEIPVVWVVWNNFGYVSIRDQQLGYFGAGRELATSFTDSSGRLSSVDFAALARSMGAQGQLVEQPSHLGDQLRAAIESGRPTVLDVRVDREARPPSTASWDLPPLPAPLPSFGWGED
jgi:acetolactate synthase I/II/III large subunit